MGINKNERKTRLFVTFNTVDRVLRMFNEGYDISTIARTLRIPTYKVADIAQKKYIDDKIQNGEEL